MAVKNITDLHVLGNVGIGTTSPGLALEVNSNASSAEIIRARYNAGYYTDYGTNNINFTGTSQTFQIRNNGSAALYISSSSNVGIGTTSPTQRLDVTGKVRARSWFTGVDDTNTLWSSTATGTYLQAAASTGTGSEIAFRRTDGLVRMLINTETGNVGIGTASPDSTLHVSSSSPIITISNSDTSIVDEQVIGQIDFKSLDGSSNMTAVFGSIRTEAEGTLDNGVNDGGKMVFSTFKQSTTLVDQMVIDGSGNVGIGTASPDARLEVSSTAVVSDDARYELLITEDNTASAGRGGGLAFTRQGTIYGGIKTLQNTSSDDNTSMYFQTRGGGTVSNRMTIDESGNVGIGTTSPSYKLDVISNGVISRFKSTNSGTGGFAEGYYENDAGDRLITGSIGSGYTNTAWAGARYMYATAGDLMIKTLGSGTNLRFYTAGATNERMRIDGSGNVGIGTTSPSRQLHVAGSTFGAMLISGVASDAFSEYDDGTNVWKAGIDYSQSAYRITYANFNGSGISLDSSGNLTVDGNITTTNNIGVNLIELGGDAEHRLYRSTTSLINGTTTDTTVLTGRTLDLYAYDDVNIRAGTGDNISFTAGGVSDAMYINSSGNVGIGTTSPGKKLEVRNVSDNESSIRIRQLSYNFWDLKSPASDTGFAISDVGGEKLRITSGGNVGIGTTSPGHKLHVKDTATDIKTEATTGAARNILKTSTGEWRLGTNSTQSNSFWIYEPNLAQYVFNIDTSGNVGIGTTSPGQLLHLNEGSTVTTTDANNMLLLTRNNHSYIMFSCPDGKDSGMHFHNTTDNSFVGRIAYDHNATGDNMLFTVDSSERMRITSAGNVGIGTTSPGAKLDVNGDLTAKTSISLGEVGVGNANGRTVLIEGAANPTNGEGAGRIFLTEHNSTLAGANSYGLSLYYEGDPNIALPSGFQPNTGNATWSLRRHDNSVNGADIISGFRSSSNVDIHGRIRLAANNSFISFNTSASAGDPKIQMGSDGDFSFQNTAGSTSLHIENGGNVGIGTTSPNAKLKVVATASNTKGVIEAKSTYTTSSFFSAFRSAPSDGSTTANGGLWMGAISNDNATISSGAIYRSAGQWRPAGTTASVISLASGQINFLTNSGLTADTDFMPSNRMAILPSGNVGIGTTSPGSKLDVNGDINIPNQASYKIGDISILTSSPFTGDTFLGIGNELKVNAITGEFTFFGDNVLFGNLSPGAIPAQALFGVANSGIVSDFPFSEALRINSSGDIGIGTTNPSEKLEVDGNILASGDITAFSDARIKENVETLPNALESIKAMRGVTYNKIGEEKQSIGVIAQEVQAVLPQLVSEHNDGMLSVAYGNITGVLIEAIKEQQKQIEELKAQLDGLTK